MSSPTRLGVLAISLACFVPSLAALNGRSAVSVTGSDINPCTPASPCRSFSTAMTNTLPGGEIIALDSGGYGPFTISQAVTVSGAPGVYAAISSPANTAISVNASGLDEVTLKNLVLLGLGTGGIAIQSANTGALHVLGCTIQGFTNYGIWSAGPRTFLDDTTVQDCTGALAFHLNGSSAQRAYVTNSRFVRNNGGVYVLSHSLVTVANTTFLRNTIAVESIGLAAGSTTDVTVANCTIDGGSEGILATKGAGTGTAIVRLSGNVISHNQTGVSIGASGTVITYGNNTFAGNNTTVTGGSLTLASLQ